MSTSGPFDPGMGFDPQMLARLFSSTGPVNWELARGVARQSEAAAAQAAAQGASPGGENPPKAVPVRSASDPLRRIRIEELLSVAELHVREITGLELGPGGSAPGVRTVSEADWAEQTLTDYKPVLEKLGASLGPALRPKLQEAGDEPAPIDPMALAMAQLPNLLGPMMMGYQTGSMVASLAARAFGQYSLPLPRPLARELLVVPDHIDAFASDWSIAQDDLALWVCIEELAHHAVLSIPHVRERLGELLAEHAEGFRSEGLDLTDALGDVDPQNMSAIQELLGNPETLLESAHTEAQRETERRLRTLVTAVEGYVDWVVDTVAIRLLGNPGPIAEALRRRRNEETEADRFVGHMLGVTLDEALYGAGHRFAYGVLERAGADGLARLWASVEMLPTPSEVEAPGLWLARIDL